MKIFNSIHKITKTSAAIMALAMIFALAAIGSTSSVRADQMDFSVSIAPRLQVSIPENLISLNFVPKIGEEVFVSDDMTVSVATNNPTGYQMTIEAATTDLTRTVADNYGNYPVVQTLDEISGGYTSDTFTVNRWGYKNGDENYNAFEANTVILSSAAPTTMDQTDLSFAAKMDMIQPARTYALELNFTAVANFVPSSLVINYDANGGSGEMASQIIGSGQSATLSTSTFTAPTSDLIFAGWNTAADGSGTSYATGATYTVPADNSLAKQAETHASSQWVPVCSSCIL